MMTLLDRVRVFPASGPLRGRLKAQPSKNYAARCLWTSALRDGATRVAPLPQSDDARAMLACCQALGATTRDLGAGEVEIQGFGETPASPAMVDPDNAGAVLRFVMGAAALGGEFRFQTRRMDSLGQRPNKHLLDALAAWGVEIIESGADGRLPIATRFHPGADTPSETTVSGTVSSQYLSSLLMVAPVRAAKLGRAQTIRVEGEDLRSRPAVETTLEVMASRGVEVEISEDFSLFRVPPGRYGRDALTVNGDWPGASAILCAAAAVPGSAIEMEGLREDAQGERRVIDTLREAGCRIEWQTDGTLRLESPKRLRAFRFDADLATDASPVLTALAALAEGESLFERAGNLRLKECDRIAAPLAELRKLGVAGEERPDSYSVFGRPEGFAGNVILNGHRDHRVVMMAAILGLRARQPVIVETAEHIAKSYPSFFEDLRTLGARVE
jgi:3-phosphoshikimate 1-carboxyvinyltransferase